MIILYYYIAYNILYATALSYISLFLCKCRNCTVLIRSMWALLIEDVTKSVYPKGVIMCLSRLAFHYPVTQCSFLVRFSTQKGTTVLRPKRSHIQYVTRVIVDQDLLAASFTGEVFITGMHWIALQCTNVPIYLATLYFEYSEMAMASSG